MTFVDTGKAIAAVTKLLVARLQRRLESRVTFINGGDLTVAAGRPEPDENEQEHYRKRLNVFLYEALFDPSLKNAPVYRDGPMLLWLVLKFLLTAYDEDGRSDTAQAHEILGEGLRALQESTFLVVNGSTDADIVRALQDNPEPLKITFDDAPSDLLARLMQGSDEKYRFSMAFQVRPIMIATDVSPSYALLVGMDYTAAVPEPCDEPVGVDVLAGLGPQIVRVSPAQVQLGDTLEFSGTGLDAEGLRVHLGPVVLTPDMQTPDRLTCTVDGPMAAGDIVSAGNLPVCVVQTLTQGRQRSSPLLATGLQPILDSAAKVVGTWQHVALPGDPSLVYGQMELRGQLLGRQRDDVVMALYRNGRVAGIYDDVVVTPGQRVLTVTISAAKAVPQGPYRVILRVNGQQARNSPEATLP